jgi:catechol 2,3-dioxygenase-like lactoylglutathione lyase family enzyme
MMKTVGSEFELRRVKHLELVCRDIARTATFYRDALGMRVVNSFDLPSDAGQRVVFDVGDGASLAFLCFQRVRAADPSASRSRLEPIDGSLITAYGSIRHVTFDVSVERFDKYSKSLRENGVPASLAFQRDERPTGDDNALGQVRRQALHCLDPDGIFLEFACWPGWTVETVQNAQDSRAEERVSRRPTKAILEPA